MSWWQALLLFLSLLGVFDRIVSKTFEKPEAFRASGYFRAEKRLSIFAILFYAAALYLCNLKYYLAWMSIGGRIPALVNIGGLAVFMLLFALIWRKASTNYNMVFGRHHTKVGFAVSNIKVNLPIVIPWIALSLFYDLATHVPWPSLQEVLQSEWGDLLFFGFFLAFVVVFFPPLVRRLWGCEPIPEGPLREHLVSFCRKQNFTSEFYFWPLFEGRVLTAGVMGVLPGVRYILITPALVETMSIPELDAVMAHEIGHVKRKHLLLYVLLIGGFSLFAGLLAKPFFVFLFSRDSFYSFILGVNIPLESVVTVVSAIPLLALTLLYFRYVFGYFMRNFERQADLHVFTAIGDSNALISAFERIANISGTPRDEPSWHHFGIGERVDYLEKCERDSSLVHHHNRKVKWSLVGYVLLIVLAAVSLRQLPLGELSKDYEVKYAEAVLLQRMEQEPDNAQLLRLMGNIMVNNKREAKALSAYEKALVLEPSNPELLNNISWLLLTSEKLELRNPLRALSLARTAANIYPRGYVLDTLATAYWANGFIEEAETTEQQAIFADPTQEKYYNEQAKRFSQISYEDTYVTPIPLEIIENTRKRNKDRDE